MIIMAVAVIVLLLVSCSHAAVVYSNTTHAINSFDCRCCLHSRSLGDREFNSAVGKLWRFFPGCLCFYSDSYYDQRDQRHSTQLGIQKKERKYEYITNFSHS